MILIAGANEQSQDSMGAFQEVNQVGLKHNKPPHHTTSEHIKYDTTSTRPVPHITPHQHRIKRVGGSGA